MHHYDEAAAALADKVLAYVRWRLQEDPVALDRGGTAADLDELAPNLIGEGPNDVDDVLAQFTDVLAPRVISCDSPAFLSFIPAAPTKASMLFDAVVSASSLNGTSWLEAAGAVHAENQVLRVLADAAGLPASAGGCFVSGGSAGNLSALVVAREVARRRGAKGRLRVLVSDQAHSSITNTARIIDVDIVRVPTTDDRLTGDAVRSVILSDPDPQSFMAVVATAGTTNAGIVDDLAGSGAAAHEHGLWFHVDGAYGAAALLAPSVRHLFDGIEQADSMIVDPHKWLFAPFDCAALLYRTPQLAKAVHTQDASYLDSIHEGVEGEWNPTDYAYHLTRRARGLAIWFSMAVHGLGAYRTAIEAALSLARSTADLIDTLDHVELVRRPELSVVMFRRIGWTEADYQRWSDELLAEQVAFVLPSKWKGEPILRFAFLHPDTSPELVADILGRLE